MARWIAAHHAGRATRPAISPHRLQDPNTLLVFPLRDQDLHHAKFVRKADGTITAEKLTQKGYAPVTGLELNSAGRTLARTLSEDLALLAEIPKQQAEQLVSELCSADPNRPAKTKLNARAMAIEETFQAKLVSAEISTQTLRSIGAPESLSAYNALIHCQKWLRQALATHPQQTAFYFRVTVNGPEQGKPYPRSPRDLLNSVSRKPCASDSVRRDEEE